MLSRICSCVRPSLFFLSLLVLPLGRPRPRLACSMLTVLKVAILVHSTREYTIFTRYGKVGTMYHAPVCRLKVRHSVRIICYALPVSRLILFCHFWQLPQSLTDIRYVILSNNECMYILAPSGPHLSVTSGSHHKSYILKVNGVTVQHH